MKTPAEMLAELGKPFPPNAIKRKNGKFDYIEHQMVTRRLNSVTPEWSFVIRDTWFRDDLHITNKSSQPVITLVVLGELTIPGLGTRSGYGVANLQPGGGEDQYKGAESDALKKAASRFGVALDLYGDDYEANVLPGHSGAGTYEDDTPAGRMRPDAQRAPQRATAAPNAPKPPTPSASTPAPKGAKWTALNTTLHGMADHEFLHEVAQRLGYNSFADVPTESLEKLLGYFNGKGDPAALAAFNAHLNEWEQRSKKSARTPPRQGGLLPGTNEVPNPRTAESYAQ